jgi:hypothetical protein
VSFLIEFLLQLVYLLLILEPEELDSLLVEEIALGLLESLLGARELNLELIDHHVKVDLLILVDLPHLLDLAVRGCLLEELLLGRE